jgi:HAD superfamily hydrolase (TIGR01490 family)
MPLETPAFVPLRRAAFFDVDNTLIDLKSMFAFQAYYWRQRPEPTLPAIETYRRFVARLEEHPQRADRSVVNRLFYESFAGRDCEDVRRLCECWFEAALYEHGEALWIGPALLLARRLKREGFVLVGVSGSSQDILAPLMAHLQFDHCLATRLEEHTGRYTGRIVPPQMIGTGKAQAIAAFMREHGLRAEHCVACGDHASDLPMLQAVGTGFVVPGDPLLEKLASIHGWQVLGNTAAAPPAASPPLDPPGVSLHA